MRDLVRDRGCQLYYYRTGQRVQFTNADQAMTFVQGTGHQMELEVIRARTREHERIDLVLTDWQMAPRDGLALLRALRSRAPAMPVVLMSGALDATVR